MPAKGTCKLSPGQQAEAVRMYQVGESTVTIGRVFGVDNTTILRVLQRHGLDTARCGPIGNLQSLADRYRAGEFLKDLAREAGVPQNRLSRHFRKIGVPVLSKAERVCRRCERPVRNLPEIIRRYEAGETIAQLTTDAGFRTWQALRKKLAEAGVAIRRYPNMRSVDTADVIAHYQAGASMSAVAELLGLSYGAVRNRLVRAGVQLRPEAETRERQLTLACPMEGDLVAELHQWGIPCTPQKAVGEKNLDIAIDGVSVAVEIERGPAFSPQHRGRLIHRTRFLLDQGWCVLFVVSNKYITYWGEVMDQLVPLIDRARAGESVFGRYGVINRFGQPMATGRCVLSGLPRIEGL